MIYFRGRYFYLFSRGKTGQINNDNNASFDALLFIVLTNVKRSGVVTDSASARIEGAPCCEE
jgi:hypothetical protein